MELSLENLNVRKERVYYYFMFFFALLIWVLITITIIWPVIGLVMALLTWLGNGLLVANLVSDSVKVNEKQLPDLYETFKEVCAKIGIKPPELYILQSQGVLNAFAMRRSGRNFVVLNSSLIEDLDPKGDEMRFLMGHEIGHLKSRHIFKQILLLPASWIPLLAPAYHRACETSCDRYGAFASAGSDGAMRALIILASGRRLADRVDPAVYCEQFTSQRGFFISWNELISSYPTLSHRVANVIAVKNNLPMPKYKRNPFSYLFGLFSFGGGGVQGVGSVMIMAGILALLAAIAIPNLLRAKMSANDALAKAALRAMSLATESYASDHNGNWPSSDRELATGTPPYLTTTYCGKIISGYKFACVFSPKGYRFIAAPVQMGVSGSQELSVEGPAKQEEQVVEQNEPSKLRFMDPVLNEAFIKE